MELRHLRRFVAVAEEGGLLTAAQKRLHTSQPLSRQIRDLESEVGVKLLERQARGVTLTADLEIRSAGVATRIEVKGTAHRSIAWGKLKVSGVPSHHHLLEGMSLYRSAVSTIVIPRSTP